MNNNQKRRFDSLHALSEQIWREWDHKTRHEWKLSFAIWSAVLVAIGTAVKAQISLPLGLVIFFGVAVFILHLEFLRWVQLKLKYYRQKLHGYHERMKKLSDSSLKEEAFTEQSWYEQPSLWIQAGITFLLVCLLVVVGSGNTDLRFPNSYNILVSIAYLLIICGSAGMILFASRFPLSSRIKDLKHIKVRFLGLNGFQVWLYSWLLIISGTTIQLIYSFLIQ